MIKTFIDLTIPNFELKVIDVRGQEESGIGVGEGKDVICSFFGELSNSDMIGCLEKVRHDMTRKHWKAVGRIMLYGFIIGYFHSMSLKHS